MSLRINIDGRPAYALMFRYRLQDNLIEFANALNDMIKQCGR